jgi:hypothetical protein
MAANGKKAFSFDGTLLFELKDHLKHPLFWWPDTLLMYPVDFRGCRVKPDELSLWSVGEDRQVPYQLSDVRTDESGCLLSADVSFISDLPSGGLRQFLLARRPPEPFARAVAHAREAQSIVLDNGKIRVRIPGSSPFPPREAPGPIIQVDRGTGWMGESRLVTGGRHVVEIATRLVHDGPLFVEYEVVYVLDRGGRYTANIRLTKGMDFVGLAERMEGIGKEEQIYVKMVWTHFCPTHRQAPNNPPQLVKSGERYEDYNWQKIDEEWVHNPLPVGPWGLTEEGEIGFRLNTFEPWKAMVRLTYANFWDERTNDAVGVFIDQPENWNDHEYALFTASDTLSVRFFYRDGTLWWKWPLATGSRSVGLAVYDHRLDKEQMQYIERIRAESEAGRYPDGVYRIHLNGASHTSFLQNRYGTLHLDRIKNWVLEYPDDAARLPAVYPYGDLASPEQFLEHLFCYEFFASIPVYGPRENAGLSPVPSRRVHRLYVDAYNRFYGQMEPRQRKRAEAALLFMAYLAAGEHVMPLVNMLGGNPNFLSDIKTIPAQMAVQFPDHPEAENWKAVYGKFVELAGRYYTRPPLDGLNLKGGRWTENLGTYVWAFLRPLLKAEFMLQNYNDGINRVANEQMARMGRWLVDSLTAPFAGEDPRTLREFAGYHYWGRLSRDRGPARLHPPQGAHSYRRLPPRAMWLLATFLERYDPLTAEAMKWAAGPDREDTEVGETFTGSCALMYPANSRGDGGTDPHLESVAYTGYGIILRAGVGTEEEVSLHIQQLDPGLNYRWGKAAAGGCGQLFYYAGGKAYSHVGKEDVGDRQAGDVDFSCNFGVWKDGKYKSIGQNVLTEPFYSLGTAQFARLLPEKGKNAYAWPEYRSRSILLAGTDYFAVQDAVGSPWIGHRFSWFVHKYDEMPQLIMLRGADRKTELATEETRGVWYDGKGGTFAVITHRASLRAESTGYGARVFAEDWTDDVCLSEEELNCDTGEAVFRGTVGHLRVWRDGRREMALIHGTEMSLGPVRVAVDHPDLGISVRWDERDNRRFSGTLFSREGGHVRWYLPDNAPSRRVLYLDGVRVDGSADGMSIPVPKGLHHWEWTCGLPVPPQPVILRVDSGDGRALVHFAECPAAERYEIELSDDLGKTWRQVGSAAHSPFALEGLANGRKYHVRVTAVNAEQASPPAREYPIYPTDRTPPFPHGLRLKAAGGAVRAAWGRVLGAAAYRLYKRQAGETAFHLLYEGEDPWFVDEGGSAEPVCEYAVSAVNLNGEGERGPAESTDPGLLTNFDPMPGEPYRRFTDYNNHPFEFKHPFLPTDIPYRYPHSLE